MNKQLIFKRMNYALLDMQSSTSQTFEQPFSTFARLIADPTLESLNQSLVEGLDVDKFLEDSSRNRFGRLAWPVDPDEVLGLKLLLIQKMAKDPHLPLNFAHNYYTVGRNLSGELHSLTRQFLIPFARDYQEFVMTACSASDMEVPGGIIEAQGVVHNITYHMSGDNARVNNNSTDNSTNTVNISSAVSNHIQMLKDEVQRSNLTPEQKAEAVEVVEEIEEKIASGRPKRAVMSALFASLPAIESVTTIAQNLSELLTQSGIL